MNSYFICYSGREFCYFEPQRQPAVFPPDSQWPFSFCMSAPLSLQLLGLLNLFDNVIRNWKFLKVNQIKLAQSFFLKQNIPWLENILSQLLKNFKTFCQLSIKRGGQFFTSHHSFFKNYPADGGSSCRVVFFNLWRPLFGYGFIKYSQVLFSIPF